MKVKLLFAWFDFWIGIFYDSKKNWIYILPIPMFGVIVQAPHHWRLHVFVADIKYRISLYKDMRLLKKQREILTDEFNRLNWTKEQVWNMTSSCGSLNHAIEVLSHKLIRHCDLHDRRLLNTAEELITAGFEREWDKNQRRENDF